MHEHDNVSGSGRLSRRELLQRSAVAGLALSVPALGAGVARGATASGSINILTWETYHDDPWLKQASKDLGLKFNVVRAGSVDELYAKARAGTVKWDLFLVDSGSIKRYKNAGLIAPIAASKVPGLKNVNHALPFNKFNKINGKLWAVPYNWGTQPMIFDKTQVPAADRATWRSLWNPKYKGKVMIPDDAYITLPMVALAWGINPWNWNSKAFATIKQKLADLRPQIRTLTTSFNDQENMMGGGEAVIGYAQTNLFMDKYPKLDISFPKQGTPFWLDNYFFTEQAASNPDVYKFVNYTLAKPWQCRFANVTNQNGILGPAAREEVLQASSVQGRRRQPGWADEPGDHEEDGALPGCGELRQAASTLERIQGRHLGRTTRVPAPESVVPLDHDKSGEGAAQPAPSPFAGADEHHLVDLVDVTKHFGQVRAVDGVSLHIHQGEFFSLLGPSGSGKTTLLNVIGGFEHVTSGQVLIEGRLVNDLPPFRRPVNTVFQSYALFPHMSVEKNVGYPLRMNGVARAERRIRVLEALETVGLVGCEGRRPDELSGGQRQRVALARALVGRPRLLLLDEPLGALDLQLRQQMQMMLGNISNARRDHVRLRHAADQGEALSMSDRVAVVSGGKIEQIGSPREIYAKPNTRFVASFIGRTNFLPVERDGERWLAFGQPLFRNVPSPGQGHDTRRQAGKHRGERPVRGEGQPLQGDRRRNRLPR